VRIVGLEHVDVVLPRQRIRDVEERIGDRSAVRQMTRGAVWLSGKSPVITFERAPWL
jgi:hypothetical protein